MSKLWVLIKREYAQVVKKKSFLIGVILTPLFMVVVTTIPALLASKKPSVTEKTAIIDLDGQGIGKEFTEKIKKYKLDDSSMTYDIVEVYNLSPNDSLEIARVQKELDSLILAKQLKNYLIICRDIENNDSCVMIAKSFSFRTSARFDRTISNILAAMRLEKSNINLDIDSVLTLTRRIDFVQQAPGGKERDFLTVYLGGIIFVMIIFATVIGFGQILMRSIIEEKNSRIVEVIISSVSPFQMMAGKIVGLGLASLTQVGVWILMGLGIYSYRGSLNISVDIINVIFNPYFLIYFVLYLVLGYLLYSTLFALVGSIVNSDKEAQNFIFPITITLVLPVILAMYIIQEPYSTIATTLSLIPFFTPTMMILRLNFIGLDTFSFSDPIVLEATLGLALTALAIVVVTWIASRIFRVGILMYGKRPTLPEIVKWVGHK